MKAKLVDVEHDGVSWQELMFVCPGCASEEHQGSGLHSLPVNTTKKSPSWDFDGNLEAPTIHPSILTGKGSTTFVCHSWLKAGVFQFLPDSTHKFSNQHVPIPDLPDWVTNER